MIDDFNYIEFYWYYLNNKVFHWRDTFCFLAKYIHLIILLDQVNFNKRKYVIMRVYKISNSEQ
jgi:hypothetical protein